MYALLLFYSVSLLLYIYFNTNIITNDTIIFNFVRKHSNVLLQNAHIGPFKSGPYSVYSIK